MMASSLPGGRHPLKPLNDVGSASSEISDFTYVRLVAASNYMVVSLNRSTTHGDPPSKKRDP